MKLHGYFRSSAAYRVRIALNLKGLGAEHLPHHLRKGEQCAPAYLAINPQGLVPTLESDGGVVLTQSVAIIEWLDETHPNPPLLPKDPLQRAKVRAFALAIACDTHPVQNLKVLAFLVSLAFYLEKYWYRCLFHRHCLCLLARQYRHRQTQFHLHRYHSRRNRYRLWDPQFRYLCPCLFQG